MLLNAAIVMQFSNANEGKSKLLWQSENGKWEGILPHGQMEACESVECCGETGSDT